MPENEIMQEEQQQAGNEADYIEQIRNLRENTVSREEYERLRADNKKLIGALARGEHIESRNDQKQDLSDLRKKVIDADNQSNLEYVQNVLKLREAVIESGERDPFLPYGKKIVPTAMDVEAANRVASVLEECVERADGDSALFTSELQRRMNDSAIPRRRK